MQLSSRGRIGQALAVATYSLLANHPAAATQNDVLDITDLHYAEESRVTVDEQVFSLQRDRTRDRKFSLRLFHDTITGATPTGAADPIAFTSPSGNTYTSTLAPIRDERYAVTADWESQPERLVKKNYGLAYSTELDYDSLGASWRKQWDSKDRMRTFTYGLSLNLDQVHAEGGIPTGLAPTTDTTRTASADKKVIDLMFGMTQVINRSSLWQLSYTLGVSNGYLTDPYKVITVAGGPSELQFEKRPDSRLANSVYFQYIKSRQDGDVLRASYRYYLDDWGILSHTIDIKYRFRKSGGWYVQPHFRVYSQSAADFYGYKFYSTSGGAIEGYASGDYRLGNLASLTGGLQTGRQFSKRLDASLRFDYLYQRDRLYLFPDNTAVIVQASFRYIF